MGSFSTWVGVPLPQISAQKLLGLRFGPIFNFILTDLNQAGITAQGVQHVRQTELPNLLRKGFLHRVTTGKSLVSCGRKRDLRNCFTISGPRRRPRMLVRRVQWSFDPKGGPEPKHLLKIGVFPLKLPQNCMILKKSWGLGGLDPRPPWIRYWDHKNHTKGVDALRDAVGILCQTDLLFLEILSTWKSLEMPTTQTPKAIKQL